MRAFLLVLLLLTASCRALPTAPWRRGCTIRARVTRPALGRYDIELELRRDGRRLATSRSVVRFDEWNTFTVGEELAAPPPRLEDPEPGANEARALRDGVVVAMRCSASAVAGDRVDLELHVFTVEEGVIEEARETLDLALGERKRFRP